MYSATFESENGKKYILGAENDTAFDMNVGSGVSVNVGKSQGFLQIGETVENFTVDGRLIEVKGVIFKDVDKKKREMRSAFAPFSFGKLTFNGRYYIRVCVQDAPSFSARAGDGRFTMALFAPYPFFYGVEQKVKTIGEIKPSFSFPTNYAYPHVFGTKGAEKYVNVLNDGDVSVPFNVRISSNGTSTNPILTNVETLETLKINGTLNSGEVLKIHRDDRGVLHAELETEGQTVDAISYIDEESNLFELKVGTNLISADDDEGGANLTATIYFNPAVVAVYED